MVEAKESGNANEEPQGMQQEAQLLSQFAEIPGISSAWIGEGSHDAHQITVGSSFDKRSNHHFAAAGLPWSR